MKTEIKKKKCSKDCVNYVILAVIIIILSLLKLGSSPIKNDIPAVDSSVFQIMGKGLLNNQIIYKDLFDHKGPIVYIINALAYIISPNVGLYIMETIILYIGLIFIYRNALQGIGDSFVPMMAGAYELIARAIVAFTLPKYLGFMGICLADPVAWLAAEIPLAITYFKRIRNLLKHGNIKV